MDLEKIREHIEMAEALVSTLRLGAKPSTWRQLQVELARAAALADCARVRSKDQVFIRQLVLARVEALSAEAGDLVQDDEAEA